MINDTKQNAAMDKSASSNIKTPAVAAATSAAPTFEQAVRKQAEFLRGNYKSLSIRDAETIAGKLEHSATLIEWYAKQNKALLQLNDLRRKRLNVLEAQARTTRAAGQER
ncbi:MAG TPA: hypothetical protein VJS66_04625 [Burkholderiales bacterium]|nr:hypothetical protein [Burkholderiales bacterium]